MDTSSSRVFERLLNDARLMFDYATDEGLQIDPATAGKFADIEQQWSTVTTESATKASVMTTKVADLMAVHNALAKLVAPATAGSIHATRPAPGLFGFLWRPPIVGLMVCSATTFALGFILTLPEAAASWHQGNLVFAAGLGASFFGLFNVHEYVKTRTFDPTYNSVYLIRFVLGVTSGLILGNVGTSAFAGNQQLVALGPGVIALLGGFSAEAVYQILQRLVEIMEAVVKGNNDDAAAAREEQLKAKNAAQLMEVKQGLVKDLATLAAAADDPAVLRKQLQDLQSKVLGT